MPSEVVAEHDWRQTNDNDSGQRRWLKLEQKLKKKKFRGSGRERGEREKLAEEAYLATGDGKRRG